MTNNAFHKLCYEFNLNYEYQSEFREYCDNLEIMSRNFYGNLNATAENKKAARDYWKKNHKVWFKFIDEVDVWIDKMPFGGYKSDKDAQKVLVEYRKENKHA